MNIVRVSFVLSALFFCIVDTAACFAAAPGDGAALYRKHCSACHPDASRLRATENLVPLIKIPPPPMPAFGEDKLPDRDAQAIAAFIRSAKAKAGKSPPSAVTSGGQQPAAGARTTTVVETPAPADAEPGKSLRAVKPATDKKTPTRNFVRKWSIKGKQNGEVTTIQQFEITANENNELAVVPSIKLADYAVKVSAFEIRDKMLKLQFTWTWKNSPSYWKTETYALSLSDNGRKLSGTYDLRAVGGTNMNMTVWGE